MPRCGAVAGVLATHGPTLSSGPPCAGLLAPTGAQPPPRVPGAQTWDPQNRLSSGGFAAVEEDQAGLVCEGTWEARWRAMAPDDIWGARGKA